MAWTALEYHGDVNFLKGGLSYADRLTTVSPTYAREITGMENGMGLDGVLRHRAGVLSGIMNGIDDTVWNPATDTLIPARFSRDGLGKRAVNKAALQQRMGLEENPDALLIGVVSRLTSQKGLDMLLDQLDELVADGMQLAMLGSGDPDLEQAFVAAAEWHLGSVGCVLGYDEALAHLIQAGSDALLAPSRFEPCGLTQLYALRYGSIPVVSRVGGLADSVIDANEAALAAGVATGIQFWPPTPGALRAALHRLLALWRDRPAWEHVQRNGMAADVSWRGSAQPLRRAVQIHLGGPRLTPTEPRERTSERGSPDTMGVTVVGDGIDVAVHAPDADAVAHLPVRRERPGNQSHPPACADRARASRPHRRRAGRARGTGLRAFGPWDPAQRPPVQSVEAAGGPVGHRDRPAVPAGSAAVRSRRPAPGRHRRAGAEGDRRRPVRRTRPKPPGLRLGPPGHLRTACPRLHHDPPGHPAGHPRDLRGAGSSRQHRSSDAPRHHDGRTDAQRRMGR